MTSTLGEILGLVDETRWERQIALVSLLSLEERPRTLRLHELRRELGRTYGGAQYDLRVLRRLAGDRVVIRWEGEGRRAALWWVNRRVEQWRNVPWVGHGRRLALSLAASLLEPHVQKRVLFPGQGADVYVPHPPGRPLPRPLTRHDEVPTTARDVHTTAQPIPAEQQVHEGDVHTTAQIGAPDTVPLTRLLSEDSSSLRHDDDGELSLQGKGGSTGRLVRAVRSAVGPVYGEPKAALDRLEASVADPEPLERFVRSLAGKIRSPKVAVDMLLDQAPDIIANPPATGPTYYRPFKGQEAGERATAEEAARHLREAREALGRPTPPVE